MVNSLMVRGKFPKRTPMTPVGLILILLGIAIAYQLAVRVPGLLAGGIAIITATVIRIQSVRASKALLALSQTQRADPWATPSRKERQILARSFKLTMRSTTMSSLFPKQTLTGYGLANRLGFA